MLMYTVIMTCMCTEIRLGDGVRSFYIPVLFLFLFTPVGFTMMVANDGLEKARAYLN